MLRNYLLLTLRHVRKQRFYAGLNIAGLAAGLTCCLLITLYVFDELSYDGFHARADRIALFRQYEGLAASGSAWGEVLQRKLAAVQRVARLVPTRALLSRPGKATEAGRYEPNFYFADTTVFDVLTLPLTQGDPATALRVPNGLLLSEAMAQKYFPNQNPVGQTLRFAGRADLPITGVLQNPPANSHLTIDFLCRLDDQRTGELLGGQLGSYWDNRALTYLLLAPGTDVARLTAKLPAVAKQTGDQNYAVWKPTLTPLRDIYLRTRLDGAVRAQNAIENVAIFSAVAAFILLLACVNYLNLASARAALRGKEVGVRKVLGASRLQLVGQFLGESLLLVGLAVVLALTLTQLTLPAFNSLAGKELSLIGLLTPGRMAALAAALLLLGLATGSYPALVLSSFRPTEVLKGAVVRRLGGARFRQSLVVVQFAVSVGMVVATLVVSRQLHFIQHKDLGYQRAQILAVPLTGSAPDKGRFARQVASLAGVASVSSCAVLPGNGVLYNKLVPENVPAGMGGMQQLYVDAQFLRTFGIRLTEGRDFRASDSASANKFIVNRAALRAFGWKTGVGQKLGYYTYAYLPEGGYQEVPVRGEVIGVVEDYHQTDLRSRIEPLMLLLNPTFAGQLAVKIRPGATLTTVRATEARWKQQFPDKPLEYSFLDEAFNATYQREVRTGRVFGLFAALAIGISCLGLLGLAAFTAEQRTKEIGIRKVLGASVTQVVALLSKDFLKLVGVACVVAFPLAWWAMNRWLSDFAYRTPVSWWIFALSGGSALLIALLTVGYQAIRAARANPVESLRTE